MYIERERSSSRETGRRTENQTSSQRHGVGTHTNRNAKTNKRYHEMLTVFKEKYGCPVVVNTSFNVRGEPIVCTPRDAYKCFMRTEMDYLLLNNFLLHKKEQKPLENDSNWQSKFDLD